MAQPFNVLSNKKETNTDIYNNTDEPPKYNAFKAVKIL